MTNKFKVMSWLRDVRDRGATKESKKKRLAGEHRAVADAVNTFLVNHPEARQNQSRRYPSAAEDRGNYGS